MKIDNIILEELHRLITEKKKASGEKSDKKSDKKSSDKKGGEKKSKKKSTKGKNALKKKNGRRRNIDYDELNSKNPLTNKSDNNNLSRIADNPVINLAAIARKVYPDHTPEGAQSQLRKKLKHEVSDSGKEYSLRKWEVWKLNRELDKLGID